MVTVLSQFHIKIAGVDDFFLWENMDTDSKNRGNN